ESFDLNIIADVLEHLDNDKQLLVETFSCLKTNGMVIITVPAYQHMWSYWDERLNHKRRYSLATIKKKVSESGLIVTKASYFNMLLYPFVYIYRIIFHWPKSRYSKKSDFSVFSSSIATGQVFFYYILERFLLKIIDLPFGLSIFVVGRKYG
ncbi:MAG: class I SAM-dependent methyltransferase, partial [Candidatus Omnitrophica bacterium]|nr:class I SAM-dependent methyltransferase [Candidatus Omnitrophota bacterium]